MAEKKEPHLIMLMQTPSDALQSWMFAENYFESHEDGMPMVFDSFDLAKIYQEKHAIDGRVIKIPIY